MAVSATSQVQAPPFCGIALGAGSKLPVSPEILCPDSKMFCPLALQEVWWKQVPHSVPVPVLRMIKGGDVGKGCLGMIQIAAPTRQCWQVVCA